ncbi:MAG: DNA-directed RNA polymerase subunit beta, partial [Dactylosporangium sp.]|nr:DNA-directed RNA polymerase subunit beta [Dactylosporangium sp.]
MAVTVEGQRRVRHRFGHIKEVLDLPNLIEVQRKSYEWFLKEGLTQLFADISPIQDFTGNLALEFIDHVLGEPKYDVLECKERDWTYSAPLRVRVRLVNRETREVKEQEVFMGDFPLMTEQGTFVINGAERVVVSQLVRSPGVYYSDTVDASGQRLYSCTVIPNRGAWLEFESDPTGVLYVRVDRTRKLPATVILRAIGYETDAQIIELLGETENVKATLDKDNTDSAKSALIEIYRRMRPGEPPTEETARQLLTNLFFEPKRYDLANVGRYKVNKKLNIRHRLVGTVAAETL